MNPYARLLRPVNLFIAALAVVIGGGLATGFQFAPSNAVFWVMAVIVVILYTGAGNALNDYYDRKVDKRAHPERPIPSGKVKPLDALYFAGLLYVMGALFAVFINLAAFLLVVFNFYMMYKYESRYKKLGFKGNIMISWLVSSTFLFGALVIDPRTGFMNVYIFIALAFLATLCREIVKDIEDMDADRGHRYTLPMKLGTVKSCMVASLAVGLAILLSPLPLWLYGFGPAYLALILLVDFVFVFAALKAYTSPSSASKLLKVAMLIALLAFIAGALGA